MTHTHRAPGALHTVKQVPMATTSFSFRTRSRGQCMVYRYSRYASRKLLPRVPTRKAR